MKKRQYAQAGIILLAGILFFSWSPPPSYGTSSSDTKQVRVIIERAAIYVEPSRSSARIETVEKGTILNLFQERKVRDVWYYVSFPSKRYGSRISGFIHESAVEPLIEEKLPPPQKEEILAPPRPIQEEKKEIKETLLAARLPKVRTFKLPRRMPLLKEVLWKPLPLSATPVPVPSVTVVDKEKNPTITIETLIITPISRARLLPSPRREKPWQEAVWKLRPALAEEKTIEPEKALPQKPEPPPSPLPAEKEEARKKPLAPVLPSPVEPRPRLPQARPRGLLTIGIGYGPSLGGAGGFLQLNTGINFSIHAGLGVYPTTLIYSETNWVKNELLYSVGLKYYLPFKTSSFFPYLDVQYGGLKVEAAQMVLGILDFTYVLGHEQKTLQGLSTLVGAELRRGRFGLNGALGVGYVLTDWKYLSQRFSFGFDFGILIYF
ncbi:MAG: hypothetical protein ACUVV5_03645 [Candidatus Aminicenantales bacterium]